MFGVTFSRRRCDCSRVSSNKTRVLPKLTIRKLVLVTLPFFIRVQSPIQFVLVAHGYDDNLLSISDLASTQAPAEELQAAAAILQLELLVIFTIAYVVRLDHYPLRDDALQVLIPTHVQARARDTVPQDKEIDVWFR